MIMSTPAEIKEKIDQLYSEATLCIAQALSLKAFEQDRETFREELRDVLCRYEAVTDQIKRFELTLKTLN